MRKKISILLLLSIISFYSFSQWQSATGLDGSNLTYMVSADGVLLAVSEDQGVFSKTASGNWHLCNTSNRYRRLLSAGNCVFALNSISTNNPSRSFDGGITWEKLNNIESGNYMTAIDTVIFFGSGYRCRSFDYGDTYDTIQLPELVQGSYSRSFCDDMNFYVHQSNDIGYNKLYFSTNYGDTWDTILTTGLFTNPYIDLEQINYLNGTFWAQRILGTSPGDLWMLDTLNNCWTSVSGTLPGFGFNDLFEYNSKVLCSVNNHPVLYFNYDNSSWVEFAEPQKVVNEFLVHDNQLFCATQQGAYSLDTNGNYTDFNQELNHRSITSISSYEDKILIAANNEIYSSSDGGSNFNRIENAYGHQIIATDSIYYTLSSHDFRVSRDEGITWESHPNWIRCPSGSSFTHLSITNKYYFLGTQKGLFRSLHGLVNWMKLENGPFYSDFWVYNVEATGRAVIAGEYFFAQKLYKSNNFGITFSDFDEFCRLRKVNQSLFLLKDTIFISHDQAQSWLAVPYEANQYGHCIDQKGDTLVVGGRDIYGNLVVNIIYESLNHWIDLTDNLPSSFGDVNIINEIHIYDGRVLIANPHYGLWYRDDILTGKEDDGLSYDKIEWVNVYPNPVSNMATFSYVLPENSEVRINIYNQFGYIIDVINEYQLAGKNQTIWNGINFPSGLYLYQATIGKTKTSGRFVIAN